MMLQDCGATPSSGPPGSSKLPWFWRRSALIVWDAFAWVLALTVPVIIRYDLQLNQSQWRWIALYTASAITLQAVGGLWSHFYLGRHRVGSFAEATWLGVLVVAIGGVLGAAFGSFIPHFPRGVALILPPTALVLMAAGRWALRAFFLDRRRRPTKPDALRALVYGAGDAGHEVARLVDTATEPPYLIVGFLDDDPDKRYLRIRGHRIFGTGEDLVATAQATEAEVVILAISDASPELIKTIADGCEDAGVKLIVVPPVREMIGGRVTLGSLREFNVADLLGRRPIHTDLSQISDYVNGKVVLVTGAGGSIGSELARQVQMLGPAKLILLDRDESALHGVQLSLYGSGLLDTDDMVLCSIRDYEALQTVFETHRPEVVFHAAALKHLPMLQRFPVEGWKTNVLGTWNVLRCAHEVGVRNFVNISTDKAADASSVLGQTKRLAERLTAWYANRYDAALPVGAVRQRAGFARFGGAHVQGADRAGRPGHGDPPRRDPLLHDHPGGLRAGAAGRRDRTPRRRAGARHGPAGQDHRRGRAADRRIGPGRHQDQVHRPAPGREAARGAVQRG